MDVTLKMDFDSARAGIRAGLTEGLTALGFAVEEQAKQNIQVVEAIDTGALYNAVYTQAPGHDGREEALGKAKAAAAEIGQHSGRPGLASEAIQETAISGDLQVKVGVCVEHGLYVEMGTESVDDRPYLQPAVATIEEKAESIVGAYIAEGAR